METSDPQTYAIIGAAMEVHRELGCGFLEAVYQDALEMELAARSIPFVREASVPVYYKNKPLPSIYRVDFMCYENIPVELKALNLMTGVEEAKMIHYLKATRHKIGLLINFGAPSLDWRRFIK
jgi:GxxExxY protein